MYFLSMHAPLLTSDRTILHIDFDSFFASVEQQDNPALRKRPIGVTATNGRTCIIASSRQAKQKGIGTGSRSYDAYAKCPDIVLVPARFTRYLEVSKKFVAICKDFSPYVELFSIDELFMDVTHSAYLFGGVHALIATVKKRIHKEIGAYITVSIGVSYNKLLAKLGSGLHKPNGVTVITRENQQEIYARAELTDICGIGERIKIRLYRMGIYTLLQLRETSLEVLQKEFGRVEGWFLKKVGFGVDDAPVIPYTQAVSVKSVGRNYCLPQNEYNKRIVLQNLYELCEEVGIKLRKLGKKAQHAGVMLSGSHVFGMRKTVDFYFDRGSQLFALSLSELQKEKQFSELFEKSSTYIRQIRVWVGRLYDSECTPLSLFPLERKKEQIQKVVDGLNNKYGRHTVRNGFLLYAPKLTTVPNGWMGDRYERKQLENAIPIEEQYAYNPFE